MKYQEKEDSFNVFCFFEELERYCRNNTKAAACRKRSGWTFQMGAQLHRVTPPPPPPLRVGLFGMGCGLGGIEASTDFRPASLVVVSFT